MSNVDVSSAGDLIVAVDEKITAVRTRTLDFSFNELADMHEQGELVIQPEFQRMFRWSDGSQSRFIESLLLELPVPPIFLIERDDRVYELIDGLQRISSFLHFRGQLVVDDERWSPLILTDCDIVPELNGRTYEHLPRALEIKLKRSYIRAEILRKESDPRLRYYMFKRLNTGGERLSEQEIRNATIRLLSNDFNQFLMQLADNPDFIYCTDAISDNSRKRKLDQELVLRFFALKNNIAAYKHDVSDFLTEYMEDVSDPETSTQFDYSAEKAVFEKTFVTVRKIADLLDYGPKVFGNVQKNGQPRAQFSVYHYESIVVGLQSVISWIDVDDREQLQVLAAVVRDGKSDQEFLTNIGPGKNDRVPMAARVGYFASRFSEALDGRH